MSDQAAEVSRAKRVAVITRTLQRVFFLERAARSVINQSMRDLVWVVVNDGGPAQEVEEIAARVRAAGVAVTVCHHPVCCGMEAASNTGIRASDSEFIAILDDDDSWTPEFLAEVTMFLDAHPDCVGCVTQWIEITEHFRGDRISYVSHRVLDPGFGVISLAEIVAQNLFPPVCHVFRREACERVGAFDEDLPVLGDWDFNIRLALEADIGILRKPLARYHIRPNNHDAIAGNSVHARRNLHREVTARIRNRAVRSALRSNPQTLALLVALSKPAPEPAVPLLKRYCRKLRRKWLTMLSSRGPGL